MKKTMTLAEFSRCFPAYRQKEWLLDSEKQPGYWVGDPVTCKMLCKIQEIWPESDTVVLGIPSGEIVLSRVERAELFTPQGQKRRVLNIRCRAGVEKPHSFTLRLEERNPRL